MQPWPSTSDPEFIKARKLLGITCEYALYSSSSGRLVRFESICGEQKVPYFAERWDSMALLKSSEGGVIAAGAIVMDNQSVQGV